MAAKKSPGLLASEPIRIGFVPLLDAMPIIAAHHQGYFADEGLRVQLERQVGWGNVRDKLVYGHLQASHALFGMSPVSALQTDRYIEPLVSIMALGTGGDAITFSRRLIEAGVETPASLKHLLSYRPPNRLVMAHVFGCSVHHYLLRDWLATGGVDPDRDVTLMVLPPMQMARQMSNGMLDGFCSGEPWNTLAESQNLGRIVISTTEILPAHPDKVLAVSRRWLEDHEETAVALIRALIRACAFCDDKQNRSKLTAILSRPEYLDMPADLLMRSISLNRNSSEPTRSCGVTSTFPSVSHCQWVLEQMLRWKHLPAETDITSIAKLAVDTRAYRKAAVEIGLDCPPTDSPAMRRNTTKTSQSGDSHGSVNSKPFAVIRSGR